ncbi:MAG: S-layer homology domain-containing protein [bacterium]
MGKGKRLQVVAWTLLLAVTVTTFTLPLGSVRVSAAEEAENRAAYLEQKAVDFILEQYQQGEELSPYTVYVLTQAANFNSVKDWKTKDIAQYLLALVGLNLGDEAEAERLADLLVKRHGENSFENSVYSDFWGYLALAEADKLTELASEDIVDYILGKQSPDGSWGETFDGNYWPDFLATTEAIRVLQRLDPEGKDDEIQAAIQSGLTYLKGFCQEDGSVHAPWDDPVMDTAALVIALLELGQDPTGPEWSQSGGKTNPVTYLLARAYNEEDNSFGGLYDELLTATYALQAYILLQDAELDADNGSEDPITENLDEGSGVDEKPDQEEGLQPLDRLYEGENDWEEDGSVVSREGIQYEEEAGEEPALALGEGADGDDGDTGTIMEGEEDPKELARDLAQKAVAFIRNKYDSEKPYPYTVYVLAQAGETVDTSWLGGKWTVLSLEREVIGQAAELDANEGTKTLAQYLLALVGLDLGDEAEAGRLAKFLVEKHGENSHGENSFENSVYSDFWGYLALAEAGRLAELASEDIVNYILGKQSPDGSWGETFNGTYWPDFLATTEAIRVLHRLDPEGENNDIKTAIQKGLDYLNGFCQEDGGVYNPWDDPVTDTAALVITLLELDKDPTGPEWTQSGGKTNSVTYLLTRAYDEEKKNFGGYDELLTAAYALQAYIMLQEAGLGDIEGDGPPTGGGGSGGGQTPGGKDPTGEFRVQVKVVGKDGTVLFGPQTVTIDDDNPWGRTALGALHATGLSYSDDGGFVYVVAGETNAGMNGWMYQVNGVVGAVIASAMKLEAGDQVLWWYSTDPNEIPSWFDVPPELPPEEKPEDQDGLDKELAEALAAVEEGEEIVITLTGAEEGLEAVFSAARVQDLVAKQITLVIKGPDPADPVLIIPAAALATEAVQGALKKEEVPAIRFGYRRLAAGEEEKLQELMAKLGENNLFLVGDALYRLEVTLGGEPLSGFATEITVRFPLATEGIAVREDINFIGLYRLSAETGEGEAIPGIPVYEEEEDRWYIEACLDRFSLFALLRYKPSFADLEGHWAREAVELMAARRIIAGMSAQEFAPDLPVTRAQLVTMLVKALELEPVTPEEGTFRDVEAGTWYYTPVETAYRAGLVAGRGRGEFDPSAPVTRQEMAVMVARALEISSGRATNTYPVEANLRRFEDQVDIAPWARGAVARLVEEGIMSGMPGRIFAPQGTATRAQAAVVLKNMLQVLGKII